MLSIEQINLLNSQNEGLKKQNKELQEENIKLVKKFVSMKTILNNFAEKFDSLSDFVDEACIRDEDENGSVYCVEQVIRGVDLQELESLLRDYIDFVEGVE